mmetsp:Transcript_108947/g.259948  ORF Transcript_108947/g.259948 Transcript_108947/m.259948 type:complete len:202 (-) Transcript_108947:836-1441(-)
MVEYLLKLAHLLRVELHLLADMHQPPLPLLILLPLHCTKELKEHPEVHLVVHHALGTGFFGRFARAFDLVSHGHSLLHAAHLDAQSLQQLAGLVGPQVSHVLYIKGVEDLSDLRHLALGVPRKLPGSVDSLLTELICEADEVIEVQILGFACQVLDLHALFVQKHGGGLLHLCSTNDCWVHGVVGAVHENQLHSCQLPFAE